jgi:hypothetical protein
MVLTVNRYAGGYYELGKWIQGAAQTPFTIVVSTQPASGNDMQTYAEGRRVKSMYRVFGSVELFTSDPEYDMNPDITTNRDEVVFNNEVFEVIHVEKWLNNIIPHYEYIIMRELEGEVPNTPAS